MRTVFKGKANIDIGRFKGLGEMMPAQLKDTTMDPRKRTLLKVRVEADERLDTSNAVERLMGNEARSPLQLHPGTRGLRDGTRGSLLSLKSDMTDRS